MNMRKVLLAILLPLLCIFGSVVGMVAGFIVGCMIAMFLVGVLQPPGTSYEYYKVGTPVGNIVILGPVIVGAMAPWIALTCHVIRKRRSVSTRSEESSPDSDVENAETK